MAKVEPNNAQQGRGKSKGAKSATWLGLLLLTTVFMPTSLILAAALVPTLIAFLFDRSFGKSFSLTVGLLNMTAVVPSLIELWTTNHSIATANEILSDPLFWMTTFGASGIGWLIFLAMPPIIKAYYEIVTTTRIRTLRERQDKLREDWGEDIAENAGTAMLEHKPAR